MRRTSLGLISAGRWISATAAPALALVLVVCAPFAEAVAGSCTATGFVRDSINLTAALINPPGTISGDVDATGCNIGIYYVDGLFHQVNNANVHGANYFGIVNNGAEVDIQNSVVSNIGDTPFDGDQHGVAIYFAYGSNAKGNIQGNYIYNYQKGGIVVNGPSTANIGQNIVIGQGPVNYIAQNGIQAGYGATTQIQNNLVVGNSYTGAGQTSSGGIIVVGGPCYGGAATINTLVQQNTGLGNDIGVWFSNLDINCNPLSTPTRDTALNNELVNNAVNNTSGDGCVGTVCVGYQAGITDQGDMDVIQNNDVCGLGYLPPGNATAALFDIDVTDTNSPIVQNNTFCSGPRRGVGQHISRPINGWQPNPHR